MGLRRPLWQAPETASLMAPPAGVSLPPTATSSLLVQSCVRCEETAASCLPGTASAMARAALQRLFAFCARCSPSFAVTVRVNAGQKKRSYRRGTFVNQAAQCPPPAEVGKCPCEWRWRWWGGGGCVIPSDRRIKGDSLPLFLSKWRQKSTAIISLKQRAKGGNIVRSCY